MTMDFDPLIQRKRERFEQLELEIADPKLFDNRKRAGEIMREHAGIKTVLAKWDELENARKQLDDNRELATSRDVEIAAMADDEIPDLEKRVAELEREMQIALLPRDENENRDAIIEIRAGTGGQGVNTTDSAVQVMHIPTGTIVRCQDGRSQLKNKEKALSILRARLLERQQQEEAAKYSAQRRGQIGTGGREEKIRTYNFPQNRLTDHRIGLTLYNLDRVIDGNLEEMIRALQAADVAERLKESSIA